MAASDSRRETFLRYVFGESSGYVCLAYLEREQKDFHDAFFKYPEELREMGEWIEAKHFGHDMYFCPQLLGQKKRTKESVETCTCAWADLDDCPPDKMLIKPTIVTETSPKRYQALWVFEFPIDPADAEEISRRIAYYHKDDGADKTGWDLSQLLRLPYTYNYKYGHLTPPTVEVLEVNQGNLLPQDFVDQYPQAKGYEYSEIPFPEHLPQDADDILKTYRNRLMPLAFHLYGEEPEEDWSKGLWQLQMFCFEAGMSREEVFVVAEASATNKYKRDGRSQLYLWKEVCRAFSSFESRHQVVRQNMELPKLLTEAEQQAANEDITFVEEYIEWAKGTGDAAWQYHQAGAFVALSSIVAGNVRLPTSFGTVLPNLWFMILADTTLTRKTTAMDLAVEVLTDIDSDAILATDGSIEGLFTSLSMRPGRPSVFLRDEFSGLLEAISKKDYYAGMAETLTKLYDGKFQKRVLRKEVLEVRDPVLIFFAGGIRTRIMSLLNYEYVASGFLPRFIFITAESDVTSLRPLGPPSDATKAGRDKIVGHLRKISNHYNSMAIMKVGDHEIPTKKTFNAELTPEAWDRYNAFEARMLQAGITSQEPDVVTPMMDRLSKSGLKAAVLIGASRDLTEKVIIEERDIVKAISYISQWMPYALEVIDNLGATAIEKEMETIRMAIVKKPGITRSELMQRYHLTAQKANVVFGTLDERGVITMQKNGRTQQLYPIT